MNAHQLAAVLIGVLGIYLLGQTITDAGTTAFYLLLDPPDQSSAAIHKHQAFATAIWGSLKLAFAVALLVFRHDLASRLVTGSSETSLAPADTRVLQAALYAVIGVYFMVKAASVLIGGVAQIPEGEGLFYLWPHYAVSVAEVLFGAALFLSGSALAGLWHNARQAGRQRASAD